MELERFKPYLANLFFIWLAVIIYRNLTYYQNFLSQRTQFALLFLAILYSVIGLLYYSYLFFSNKKPIAESNGLLALRAISKFQNAEKREKVSLLFLLVKFFFTPIMLNFCFSNLNALNSQSEKIFSISALNISTFNNILFPLILSIIFLLDTAYFTFGYLFESKHLSNKIRSVEPTLLGWSAALICYPPFNTQLNNVVNWYANDHINLSTPLNTFFLRIGIIILLVIYLSATIALGTKSSNLTNRGIVSRGPYSIVRHPAYVSKNLAWWLTILPIMSIPAAVSMATWSIIYHIRTLTEETHLLQDPEYVEYCKKVKYRYIPGVY